MLGVNSTTRGASDVGTFWPAAVVTACLLAAVTLLRWLSWRPYSPFMLPYDALVLGASVMIAMPILRRIRAAAGLAVGSEAIAITLGGSLALWWIGGVLQGTGRALALASMALLAIAVALGVVSAWRRRAGRVPFGLFCAIVAASVVVSIASDRPGFRVATPLVLAILAAAEVRAPRRHLATLLAAAAVTIFCATIPPEPAQIRARATASASPSLVLIVLDTLRRDHMSLYGYSRPTTPRLDEWSTDALVMEHMASTSSWTLPAHASMFTGLHPRAHGARGYRSQKLDNSTYALAPEQRTLAEIAGDAGFATGAIVANHYFLGPEFGVDQGFQDYIVGRPERGFGIPWADALARRIDPARWELYDWSYYRAGSISDLAIDWIRSQSGPYFLFVNYLDVHRPNGRPANAAIPWEDEQAIPGHFPALTKVLEGEPLAPRIHRSLVNAYDRELMALDAELARLLAFIESSQSEAGTYVIVTSDHGEYFGEHQLIDHMMHLYHEATAVPLLVKGPGVRAGRNRGLAQSTDIFATALDALGVAPERAPRPADSRSLLEDRPDVDRATVAEWYSAANGRLLDPRYHGRFERGLAAIERDSLRLFEYDDGEIELYDVVRDPGETRDIAERRPDAAASLREELTRWRARTPPRVGPTIEEPDLSAARQEQLRQLGYAE